MSEIKLTADSGGGSVSFKGPATTTDNAAVPFVLPVADGSAGQYLKTDGSKNLAFATVTSGLTEADQWRISSDFSTAAGDITANWERADTSINAGTKGTGMSQSSGVFTFPDEGWWLVLFQGNGYEDSDTATILCQIKCGSTAVSEGKGFSVGSSKFTAWTAALMDVTDKTAAAAQVKFRVESSDSVNWIGASAVNATWAMFLRLGDT